jgi:hypothetical protein
MRIESIAINHLECSQYDVVPFQPVRSKAKLVQWKKFAGLVICVAMLAGFAPGQLQAQVEMGAVTGTIKDASGALVIAAKCTLTNVDTGVSQVAKSTRSGGYTFPSVQTGNYLLKVAAPGFKESEVDKILVHVATTVTEDVTLHVGPTTEEVTVTSAAPLLQAQDASLGMTIDNEMATELPLFGGGSGRNFMDLTTLAAGSQFTGSNDNTSTFLVHGIQSGQVDVRLNGADDNSEVFGGIEIPPIPDSIQEFKLQTGNNSAELGEFYGSVVNVVTKTGSNRYHGAAWEYNENDMFAANDYFNKLHQLVTNAVHTANRPARLKENSYGANIGGPLTIPHFYNGHNRTFFFVDFQRTQYVSASANNNYTVPTAAMQSSGFTNLSDTLTLAKTTKVDGLGRTFQSGTVLDPTTTRSVALNSFDPVTGLQAKCPTGSYCPIVGGVQSAIVRDPYFQSPAAGCPGLSGTTNFVSTFAGGTVPLNCLNQLPAGRLDTNALNLLKLMPAANQINTSGSYVNNYNFTGPQPQSTPQWDLRIDHTFNDKDSIFGTYSYWNHTSPGLLQLPGILEGGANVGLNSDTPTNQFVATETHVFSASLTNDFRFSYERRHVYNVDPGTIRDTLGIPAQYGIQGIPQVAGNGGLPQFSISNLVSFGSRQNPTESITGAWGYYDNVTKVAGKHEFKFGAEWLWTFGNITQVPYARGQFSYNGVYSNVPGSGDAGPAVADFLLTPAVSSVAGGLSTSTNLIGGASSFQGNNNAFSTYHAPYLAFYGQDKWMLTPMLTFNVGLRYDYFGPYYSDGGQEANFWMGGNGNDPNGSAFYVAHDGCATTMSPYFRGLLAYDNIPIICQANNAANEMPKANWGPRLGVAYRILPNLVIRAGAGVAYGGFGSVGYGGTLGTNYPFRFNVQSGSANNAYTPQLIGPNNNVTATMENTFSNIDLTNPGTATLPLGSIALYGKQYHFHVPHVTTLNLAVQWQFTKHDSIEARYVGNIGQNLESANPYHNAPRELLTPSTTVVTLSPTSTNPYAASSPDNTIPFPNLAVLAGPMEITGQVSNYESAEVEYQHQLAQGFNMDANYTFASCLSDAQGGQQNDGGPGNGRAPWVAGFGGYRADYDRCSSTATHVFKLSGQYALPFGKGNYFFPNANGFVDAVIGGWKIDPIFIASSGFLANVTCQGTIGGNSTTGGFTGPWFATTGTAWSCNAPLVKGVNPNTTGPADLPRSKITGYFNSTAFTAPASPVMTNGQTDFSPLGVRGNQIYGPGWYNVDLAIHKQFKTSKETKIEIQAQAINAFNHVQLNNPAVSSYVKPVESLTAGFGTITGDHFGAAGRVWQFVGKFLF